jgi:Peptidase propeptide and YPEB domain
LSTAAGTKPALRDRALARIALLAVVLLAALLVARTCGSSEAAVSQEEAIEIAKRQIDFEPRQIQIRNVPRGLEGRRSWAVSLYTGTVSSPGTCRLVEIDAESGRVAGIRKC